MGRFHPVQGGTFKNVICTFGFVYGNILNCHSGEGRNLYKFVWILTFVRMTLKEKENEYEKDTQSGYSGGGFWY